MGRNEGMIFALLLIVAACAPAAENDLGSVVAPPRLGHVVDEGALAPWEITVFADGSGLPPGGGSARTGAAIYAQRCASCHGPKGEGAIADRLVGGRGTLADVRPIITVGSYWPYATTLFDYVRRAMPYDAPKSLDSDEIYAVTAYLLFLNGIIEEDDVMNPATLPRVEMPNRKGFVSAYP